MSSEWRIDLKTAISVITLILGLGSLYWTNRGAIGHLEEKIQKLEKQVEKVDGDVQRLEIDLASRK